MKIWQHFLTDSKRVDFYSSCTHFQTNLDEIGTKGCRESEINVLGNHIQLNFLLLFCVCQIYFFFQVSTHSASVLPSHYLQLKYSQENENKTE